MENQRYELTKLYTNLYNRMKDTIGVNARPEHTELLEATAHATEVLLNLIKEMNNLEEKTHHKNEENLNKTLRELGFSWKAIWSLESCGVKTLEQLIEMGSDKLWKVNGIGKKAIADIELLIEAYGHKLK